MRNALESEIRFEMLPSWIDLIFGRKQHRLDAVEANKIFFCYIQAELLTPQVRSDAISCFAIDSIGTA